MSKKPKAPSQSGHVTIGAVIFKRTDGTMAPLMGDARVAALTAFYLRQPIPDGLVACGDFETDPSLRTGLRHEDVNWETSGIPKMPTQSTRGR